MTSIDTGGASTPSFSETASTWSLASVFAAAAAYLTTMTRKPPAVRVKSRRASKKHSAKIATRRKTPQRGRQVASATSHRRRRAGVTLTRLPETRRAKSRHPQPPRQRRGPLALPGERNAVAATSPRSSMKTRQVLSKHKTGQPIQLPGSGAGSCRDPHARLRRSQSPLRRARPVVRTRVASTTPQNKRAAHRWPSSRTRRTPT